MSNIIDKDRDRTHSIIQENNSSNRECMNHMIKNQGQQTILLQQFIEQQKHTNALNSLTQKMVLDALNAIPKQIMEFVSFLNKCLWIV